VPKHDPCLYPRSQFSLLRKPPFAFATSQPRGAHCGRDAGHGPSHTRALVPSCTIPLHRFAFPFRRRKYALRTTVRIGGEIELPGSPRWRAAPFISSASILGQGTRRVAELRTCSCSSCSTAVAQVILMQQSKTLHVATDTPLQVGQAGWSLSPQGGTVRIVLLLMHYCTLLGLSLPYKGSRESAITFTSSDKKPVQ